MITLATLHLATAQQVFDQIALHLLKQNKKSLIAESPWTRTMILTGDNGKCAYRGEGGTSCAAGCLIGEKEYNPQMDIGANSWTSLIGAGLIPTVRHAQLISLLQSVHDQYDPDAWPRQLVLVAQFEELDSGIVENYK